MMSCAAFVWAYSGIVERFKRHILAGSENARATDAIYNTAPSYSQLRDTTHKHYTLQYYCSQTGGEPR